MEVTQEEARQALADIEIVRRQARRAVAYGGAPYYSMLWGAIWFLGFLGSQFLPYEASGLVWAGLSSLGGLLSLLSGIRLGLRVRSPLSARIGLFWLSLLVYGALWIYLARPADGALVSLFISTLAMFGYVVMGLWLDNSFVWLGLGITILALIGYFGVRPYYSLWMALLGGGALFGSGLYILRRWK